MPSKVKGTKSPNAASVVDLNAEFRRVAYGFATDKESRIGYGSTAGIGFAISAGLAAERAKVIINGRSEKRVGEVSAMTRQKHPQARLAACAGDLSDAEAAQRVTTDFPQVDILVNNLGVYDTLARGLAETTAGTAVTVNSVLAGPTRSEGVENFVDQIAHSRGIEQSLSRKSFSPLFALARCSNASLAPTK